MMRGGSRVQHKQQYPCTVYMRGRRHVSRDDAAGRSQLCSCILLVSSVLNNTTQPSTAQLTVVSAAALIAPTTATQTSTLTPLSPGHTYAASQGLVASHRPWIPLETPFQPSDHPIGWTREVERHQGPPMRALCSGRLLGEDEGSLYLLLQHDAGNVVITKECIGACVHACM